MANDINSVAMSFTDILLKNYKQQLLEGDVSAILIDMLDNETVLEEIAEIFTDSQDFVQFFIFYFKNILSNKVEFSLAPVFLNVLEEGNHSYVDKSIFHGDYKFKEKLELSANYFKGVANIPWFAFFGWSGLDKVTLSNDVKSIGDRAFYHCTSLTSIEIPNSVKRIEDSAFCGCSSLTSITLPESVTRIGAGTFNKCDSLESVVILSKLRKIPQWTFISCHKLTNVVISKYIKVISDSAFEDCWSLKTIALPDGLEQIGYSAFKYCTSLSNIVIPDSVTKIQAMAFLGCTSLTSVQLPSKLEDIGYFIFGDCKNNLNNVTYNGTKEQWLQIMKDRQWFSNWASSFYPKQIKCTDGIIEVRGERDYVV